MKPTMLYLRYDMKILNGNKCGYKPEGIRCGKQATRFMLFYELRNPRRVENYVACEEHWGKFSQEIKKSHNIEWLGGH